MKICICDWKQIEKSKHSYWDYSGMEVLTSMCQCKKCGKKNLKSLQENTQDSCLDKVIIYGKKNF